MTSCESCERLKAECEVQLLGAQDAAAAHEHTVRELRRLLEKETALVRVAAPDPMSPCADCAHNFALAKAAREANAAEYRWIVHFVKFSKDLRLELQAALTDQRLRFIQLKGQYDELKQKQTDPHCRDREVQRLRAELEEARQSQLGANRTALTANQVADALRRELDAAVARLAEMEAEADVTNTRMAGLEDALDTFRRAGTLRDCTVSECKDYTCRKRLLDQITLRKELAEALRAQPPPQRSAAPRARTALLVADRAPSELLVNLQRSFIVFPGWSSEELDDGAAFADFVSDLPPAERETNLRWALAACNQGAADIRAEDLGASKLVRRCFSACLRAIGGAAKKRGAALVWTNVRKNGNRFTPK